MNKMNDTSNIPQRLAVLYSRSGAPSLDDAQRLVAAQLQRLSSWARQQGYTVVRAFSDCTSPGAEGSTGLAELLDFVWANPSFEIIVASVDRLTRNEAEFQALRTLGARVVVAES